MPSIRSDRNYLAPGKSHVQWNLLWPWLAERRIALEEGLRGGLILFGEWCYAKHSVRSELLGSWKEPCAMESALALACRAPHCAGGGFTRRVDPFWRVVLCQAFGQIGTTWLLERAMCNGICSGPGLQSAALRWRRVYAEG